MENNKQVTEKKVFIPNKDSKRKPKPASQGQKGKKRTKQKKERLDDLGSMVPQAGIKLSSGMLLWYFISNVLDNDRL